MREQMAERGQRNVPGGDEGEFHREGKAPVISDQGAVEDLVAGRQRKRPKFFPLAYSPVERWVEPGG